MTPSSSFMDPQFEELAQRIADDVGRRFSTRFDDAEKRLKDVIVKQLREAEQRLSDGARANMEDLRSTVKSVAEGYGGTLDRIERQLIDLNKKVDTKITDHDFVLKNHASRIATLEPNKIS